MAAVELDLLLRRKEYDALAVFKGIDGRWVICIPHYSAGRTSIRIEMGRII